MLGSVAEGAAGSRHPDVLSDWFDRLPAVLIGVGLMALAFGAYWLPGNDRFFNHFVWQAMAFLDGRAAIDWPIEGNFPNGNSWMQDVYPLREVTGNPETPGALLPFPPLPAILLMPFVAIWGLATDIRAVSVLLGVIDVGIAWWALGRLAVSRRIRLATTIFFAFGTVFWYAAQLGTTWFFAHVAAVTFLLLALGVALGSDPDADEAVDTPTPAGLLTAVTDALRRPFELIDRRQLLAGVLFGIACTARLTVVFGAPFFMFVGGGGSWARRSISAGIGAAIPVTLLLLYNLGTTGHPFHPGYEYQYEIEARGYALLNYHPEWSIEDTRYLPQNVGIMFVTPPAVLPEHELDAFGDTDVPACIDGASRALFDQHCPIAIPRTIGMSILLTSPAYLFLIPALRRGRSRLVVGALVAVAAIALVNLMHFSQGWVQFGYRFSNDFVVFALPLVAMGMQRRGRVGLLGFLLVLASVLINLWGVIWGNILGW